MSNEQRLIRRYLARYRNLKAKEEYLQRELNELREDFKTSALHAINVNGGGGFSSAVVLFMDTDWSIRKMKAVGVFLVICAVYGILLCRTFGIEGIGIPKFVIFLMHSNGMKFFTNISA